MKEKKDLYFMLEKAGVVDLLDQALKSFEDEIKQEYTKEEDQAIEDLTKLLEAEFPKDFNKWRKFLPKNILVLLVRIFKRNNKHAVECIKKLSTLFLKTYPDILAQVDISNVKKLLAKNIIQIVKRTEDEGPGILVFRAKNFDPAEETIENAIIASGLSILAISISSPILQKRGFVSVTDSDGFKLAHAKLATFDLARKGIRFHDAVPHNICKGSHIFNSNSLLEKTFNFFKWMLPKSITSKLNFTKNDHSFLQTFVSKDKLPVEFWGTIPDSEAYYNVEEKLYSNPWIFELMEQFQTVFLKFNNIQK